MLSRALAVLGAASMLFVTVPAQAQERTPTSRTSIPGQNDGTSDLLVMLGAILAAALITVLATQIGDDPASP
jgi:phosphate/sulfate permease